MRQNVLHLPMGSAGAVALSAAARMAVPEPTAFGSRFYAWFYDLTQRVLLSFCRETHVKS